MFKWVALLMILIPAVIWGQETVVTGKITDANTSEPLAFASITFLNITGLRVSSDFEGKFTIKTSKNPDSIKVQLMGYQFKVKKVVPGQVQIIDFQLSPEQKELPVTIFKAKANPAHRIIDSLIRYKNYNSPARLEMYECENFNKLELAVNNVSAKLKKNALVRKLGSLLDTANYLAGEDGKAVLPVFVSESVTDYYFQRNPLKTKDFIKATKVTGVGVEDGSVVSQMTGSLFQDYNFYNNWITILEKQFPSPLNDNYKNYYYYRIADSTQLVDGHRLYQIAIRKKQKNGLQFSGTIWIEDSVFAVRQMILEIDKSANLNFIEKIKFQFEYIKTSAGPWLPYKTRITLDIDQLTQNSAGFIARYYTMSSNIKTNIRHDAKFFDRSISLAEDAKLANDSFWQKKRNETGSREDQRFYMMVDSIRNLPVVKTYVDYIELLVGGYKTIGKFDIGPYIMLYNHNVVEGNRFRMGFTTNYKLTNRHYAGGYLAYGTLDKRFKYSFFYEHIMSRKPWTKAGFEYRDDNEAIGLLPSDNSQSGNLFSAVSLFTRIKYWSKIKYGKLFIEWAPVEALTARLKTEYKTFDPTGPYIFAYHENPFDNNSPLKRNFNNASVTLELRYAKGDMFLQNDFSRINVGTLRRPALTLSYTKGFKNVFNSDFNYHQIKFQIKQNLYMRKWGTAYYQINASKFFNPLPYPMLDVQLGNQSFIYTTGTYNLMRFVEFVTDQSYSAYYEHQFGGGFLNRIKGVRNWKLRMVAHARGLWGSISETNAKVVPEKDMLGNDIHQFNKLTNTPYVEAGYGIENIFKLLRVDFVHRLTYLSNPGVRPFGVFLSVQFKL